MLSLRTFAFIAAIFTLGLAGCAQMPIHGDAHHPYASPAAGMPMNGPGASIAGMDEQIKAMQAMHDKMMQAKTPEQRNALMAEHMKVMQDSMAMMGSMGSMGRGGMMGQGSMDAKPGMPGMHGKGAMDGAMGMDRQMMEKCMQMMQSMMQMMTDRVPSAPAKP